MRCVSKFESRKKPYRALKHLVKPISESLTTSLFSYEKKN